MGYIYCYLDFGIWVAAINYTRTLPEMLHFAYCACQPPVVRSQLFFKPFCQLSGCFTGRCAAVPSFNVFFSDIVTRVHRNMGLTKPC